MTDEVRKEVIAFLYKEIEKLRTISNQKECWRGYVRGLRILANDLARLESEVVNESKN